MSGPRQPMAPHTSDDQLDYRAEMMRSVLLQILSYGLLWIVLQAETWMIETRFPMTCFVSLLIGVRNPLSHSFVPPKFQKPYSFVGYPGEGQQWQALPVVSDGQSAAPTAAFSPKMFQPNLFYSNPTDGSNAFEQYTHHRDPMTPPYQVPEYQRYCPPSQERRYRNIRPDQPPAHIFQFPIPPPAQVFHSPNPPPSSGFHSPEPPPSGVFQSPRRPTSVVLFGGACQTLDLDDGLQPTEGRKIPRNRDEEHAKRMHNNVCEFHRRTKKRVNITTHPD